MHVSAIIPAGGRGSRFGAAMPKQLLPLAGRPVLAHSVGAVASSPEVAEVVVALPADLVAMPPAYLSTFAKPVTVVAGGERRRDSVANAFAAIASRTDVVLIHDAARPLVSHDVIRRTVEAAATTGAAIAAIRASDTVKQVDDAGLIAATLPREQIYLAQTPQAFRVDVLRAALRLEGDATDEAALAERAGYSVAVVDGDVRNMKITTPDDLVLAERLLGRTGGVTLRIGNGYDLHRLVAGRPLVLGGVRIPFERGLDGHSDADAVCHAVTDAVLGACGAGDIGRHFPDTDPAWKDADSIVLLRRAAALVRERGFAIVNVDVVVIAQQPKLAPHAAAMGANVAAALGIDAEQVSVKGKTNEGVDSMGTGASIAVHAVALLNRIGQVSPL
jgi:2-C-methyl-D-erythritol 4-phosphate cytidylyltransferase/2-C-methyl-D-erythritol 2,4-cyclodiphosphate synthase